MQRPVLFTWLRVLKHATAACEGVRKSDWDIALEEVGTTIVWWLAFIAKLNELRSSDDDGESIFAIPLSPSEIVWNKYPTVCPIEFGLGTRDGREPAWSQRPGTQCTCLARKEEVENRPKAEKQRARRLLWSFAARNQSRQPGSIADLDEMLRRIFAGPTYALSASEIALHLMEEVGEVSQALAEATISKAVTRENMDDKEFRRERKNKILGIAEELADVFSWAVTLVDKIRLGLSSFDKYFARRERRTDPTTLRRIRRLVQRGANNINIAEIIWHKYGAEFDELRCSECGKRQCGCDQEKQRLLHGASLQPHKAKLKDAVAKVRLERDRLVSAPRGATG